jgi:hypothetical protein
MKIRPPYNNINTNRNGLYRLYNESLDLAKYSYKKRISILQALEEVNPSIRKILYILGNGEIRKSPEYIKEINLLRERELIECNDNYCEVKPQGTSIYKKYEDEKDALEGYLEGLYRARSKIDIINVTSIGLDSLLKYIGKNGFPEPKRRNIDPFAEILFIQQPENFTARILTTEYLLILLILYKTVRNTDYYITGRRFLKEIEGAGIYIKRLPAQPLIVHGLIEKLPVDSERNKYALTPIGEGVAKHIALHAYAYAYISKNI